LLPDHRHKDKPGPPIQTLTVRPSLGFYIQCKPGYDWGRYPHRNRHRYRKPCAHDYRGQLRFGFSSFIAIIMPKCCNDRFAPRSMPANLAVAKAQLEKDKASLVYTKANSERLAQLSKAQAVSQDQADNAKNAYDQASAQIIYDEATIEQHQAQLEAALVNLEYTNIVSPVNGTVVSRNVTAGQTVASSFQTPTLFLIATDLTQMRVDANVSESDIGGVKVGNKTTFTVDAFLKRVFVDTAPRDGSNDTELMTPVALLRFRR